MDEEKIKSKKLSKEKSIKLNNDKKTKRHHKDYSLVEAQEADVDVIESNI